MCNQFAKRKDVMSNQVELSVLGKIKKDQLQSRKDRDHVKSSILTTLIGEAQTKQINEQRDLTDVELTDIKEKLKESVTESAGYWSNYYVTSSDWKSDNAIEGIIAEMIEESQHNDEDFV